MTILVVDDDESILEFVNLALSEDGYEVMTARDGKEAMQTVQRVPPDVILLDMHMPVMNGWEFAASYSQRSDNHAKIVVLTAGHNAAGAAQEIAADAFLPKPFNLDQLLDVVAQYE